MDADAGVITFSNIHPGWSYTRIEKDEVVEVAEKKHYHKMRYYKSKER